MAEPAFDAPIPILRMFDEALTRAFYLDFLGFRVRFEHRFHDGAPLYLGVEAGACVLHLSGHFGDATPGSAVRIRVRPLDPFVKGLQEKRYRHARPGDPVEQSWGTRELLLTDPSGNRLVFYEELQPA